MFYLHKKLFQIFIDTNENINVICFGKNLCPVSLAIFHMKLTFLQRAQVSRVSGEVYVSHELFREFFRMNMIGNTKLGANYALKYSILSIDVYQLFVIFVNGSICHFAFNGSIL